PPAIRTPASPAPAAQATRPTAMLFDIPRETFLALCRIKSSTLDQRVRVGEAVFSFGCERPARPGWYLVLDAFAMILASIMNVQASLQLKQAVKVVREEWPAWTDLVTETERW